mgnify:CR=1 FL=1
MTEFNSMTVMAALQVIEGFHSHSDLETLEVEWGIHGRCRTNSKSAHIVDLANIAIQEKPNVISPEGKISLAQAIISKALTAPLLKREGDVWKKFLAGLRFDGFDIYEGEEETISGNFWKPAETKARLTLRRMLPNDIQGLDFHEAENEVAQILNDNGMTIPKGHLDQAVSAFSRGEWASSNAQLRTFYESYLDEIALALGCEKSVSSKDKRDYLGKLTPPFLSEGLNEWNSNNQKPQYIQGLMSRMHPEGSHAGLSEEDDAAFRLQITLITARLLLRRFNKYKRSI